jgi:predicted permease
MKWWWRLVRSRRLERELDAELRDHIERQIADHLAQGLSDGEARRRAHISMGGVEQVKELCRDVRRPRLVNELCQDLRFGFRMMRRNPLVTGTVVLALALGIGTNAAVFSVVDAILLREIELPHPEQLGVIWKGPLHGEPESGIAPANAIELGNRLRTASIAPFANTEFIVQQDTDGEHVSGMRVASNFFSTLEITPAIGRDFLRSDDVSGADRVVVLGHDLWQRRFGGDSQLVGQSVTLSGQSHLVVGVMPSGFRFPELFGTAFHPEIWTPLRFSPQEAGSRGSGYMFALVRRQPQASWRAVQAELDNVSRAFARLEPRRYTEHHLKALLLHEQVVGSVRIVLLVLWGAVTCVLLAACANVAHILLSRATVRSRELAIRTSLGATRARLVRQLLTESLVLGFAGAALGFVLAVTTVRVCAASGLLDLLPRAQEIVVDMRVLAFVTCAALATSAMCGVMPALQLSRVYPQDAMRRGAPTMAGGGSASTIRAMLVVGQIAVALLLAVGAGLLVRSYAAVQRVDLGFTPEDVLTFNVSLPTQYTSEAAIAAFNQLQERLESLPEVSSVGALSLLPLSGGDFSWTFLVRDLPLTPGTPLPRADVRIATPGALEALRVPIRLGRSFLRTDDRNAQPVAVVSETFARQSWPGDNPVGKQVKLEGALELFPWMTVVGVAADVRFGAPDRASAPTIYRPLGQHSRKSMAIVLRTTRQTSHVVPLVREQVRSLDPNAALVSFREFGYYLSRSVAQRRLFMTLLSVFAAITLALALTGVYGVLAYAVTLRTREIGIHLALGASRTAVVWTVMRQPISLTLLGLVCGLAASLVARRALSQQLFGVAGTDPLTLGAVSLLVLTTALLACYRPARSAASVDPISALRME